MIITTIYIDVLIFTNVIINYCILSAVKKFLHLKVKEYRIILSSIVGAICSLVVLFDNINSIVSIIIKLFVSFLITIIGFYNRNIKECIKLTMWTFAFCMIFNGVLIAVYQIIKPKNMAIINDTVYFQCNPITLIIISVCIYILILIVMKILDNDIDNFEVSLEVKCCNQTIECKAKVDTGCNVVEPFSQEPVIIIEESIFKANVTENLRIVPYNALGSQGILKAYKAKEVYIDKKRIDKIIYIGVYNGKIDENFKAIINAQILR